jgi:NAD(P)-dependent dehydrogenase (short-subunit alcohol dehydrogenase family)
VPPRLFIESAAPTQTFLTLLADGGRIVNLSTGLTRTTHAGYGACAAVKGAVEVLTRYMAQELGPRGISVNCVAPGAIELTGLRS